MNVIEEVEMSSQGHLEDDIQEEKVEKATDHRETNGHKVFHNFRPASLKILNHVKISVKPETPVSTLKGILMISKSNLSFSKKELRKAEERMTQAFIEFYKKLRTLKGYW